MATILPLLREPCYPDAKSTTPFQDGLEFQDYCCQMLAKHSGVILQNLSSKKYQIQIGENLQGFEIKLDDRCTETGRLSIEVAEKSRNEATLPWTPSGICRSDNTWLYIQGNRKVLFVFAKQFLLNYFQTKSPPLKEKYGTIRTFYLSFDVAKRHAAKVLIFDPQGIEKWI